MTKPRLLKYSSDSQFHFAIQIRFIVLSYSASLPRLTNIPSSNPNELSPPPAYWLLAALRTTTCKHAAPRRATLRHARAAPTNMWLQRRCFTSNVSPPSLSLSLPSYSGLPPLRIPSLSVSLSLTLSLSLSLSLSLALFISSRPSPSLSRTVGFPCNR